jgi:outer membrane murein-binding lipoprotein Lpp
MKIWIRHLAALTVMGGVITGSHAGCVSSSTFEQAQRDAERKIQYEQRQNQELATSNKQLKHRLEELESAWRAAREDAARTEKLFKETRDELLSLKIEREQQRPTTRERLSKTEKFSNEADRLKQERTEEAVRRLKDLLRQIQATLDQVSGREPL